MAYPPLEEMFAEDKVPTFESAMSKISIVTIDEAGGKTNVTTPPELNLNGFGLDTIFSRVPAPGVFETVAVTAKVGVFVTVGVSLGVPGPGVSLGEDVTAPGVLVEAGTVKVAVGVLLGVPNPGVWLAVDVGVFTGVLVFTAVFVGVDVGKYSDRDSPKDT